MAKQPTHRALKESAQKHTLRKPKKVLDGHLMVFIDAGRPGGGRWIHHCETEEQCGSYNEADYADERYSCTPDIFDVRYRPT